mmetsp:Transcript_2484/g.5037  ORF Transcript_2484/g.5037 Transcript_2484/m.5037 type:complete len:268 (+) Transcript_2484:271-1074(+)
MGRHVAAAATRRHGAGLPARPPAFMPDEMGGMLVVAAERGAAQFVDAREAERRSSPRAFSRDDAVSSGNLTLLPTDATLSVAASPEDDNAAARALSASFFFFFFLLFTSSLMSSRVILSRGATPFVLVTNPSTKPRCARPPLLSLCRINSSARLPIMTPRTLLVALSNLRYSDGRGGTDASLSHRPVPPLLVLRAFVAPRPLAGRLDVSLLRPRPPPPPLPDRRAPWGIVAFTSTAWQAETGRNWAYIASSALIEICGNLMWKFKKL